VANFLGAGVCAIDGAEPNVAIVAAAARIPCHPIVMVFLLPRAVQFSIL
jgi:hypothetical protein